MTNDQTTQPDALTRTLAYGVYVATDQFRSIPQHSCVCFPDDLGLVAVTGPAGDPQSERYAEFFAAAPALLAACQDAYTELKALWEIFDAQGQQDGYTRNHVDEHLIEQLRLAIAEARGEKG